MKVYLLAMALLAGGGQAVAQEAPLPVYGARATLADVTSTPRPAIIDGRSWRCDAGVCIGRAVSAPKSQPMAFECLRVAKTLGPLARYVAREEREERSLGAGCRNP